MSVWMPGTVVGAHRIFVERMNFLSLWGRNDTGIFEQSKMPSECIAARSAISQSLGKLQLLFLWSRKPQRAACWVSLAGPSPLACQGLTFPGSPCPPRE